MKPTLYASLAVLGLWLWTGCATAPTTSPAETSLAGAQSHYALSGTNRIYYLTVGQGPRTIVLVHGWAGNSGFWRDQIPALAGRARLILLDLPGHGQSDKPNTDYSMDFFASAVLAVMRDALVDKAVLVGHSMGTPIICRVQAQAPDKVAALVAVDGMLRRPSIPAEQVENMLAAYRSPAYLQQAARFIDAMFPNPATEPLRNEVREEMLRTPQHVMLGAMTGMFGAGQPAWDLPAVNVPVIAIHAKNPMWTAEYETFVRGRSPQTDFRVLEGVGHFLMLEKPAEFNAVLTDALAKFGLLAP